MARSRKIPARRGKAVTAEGANGRPRSRTAKGANGRRRVANGGGAERRRRQRTEMTKGAGAERREVRNCRTAGRTGSGFSRRLSFALFTPFGASVLRQLRGLPPPPFGIPAVCDRPSQFAVYSSPSISRLALSSLGPNGPWPARSGNPRGSLIIRGNTRARRSSTATFGAGAAAIPASSATATARRA